MRVAVLCALCVASTLAFSTARLAAQVPQVRPVPDWGFTLGIEAVTGLFEPRVPARNAYATRGGGMGLAVGTVYKGHILVGGEAGWAFFGGDREFPPDVNTASFYSRTTNSIYGSMYTGLITSAIGRRNQIGRKLWLGAHLGSARWSGERRAEQCPTCPPVPLRMRAGPYVSPFIVFGGGDQNGGGGFRIAYTHFLREDASLRSSMAFGLYFNLLNLY